jgi:hypothetical protein
LESLLLDGHLVGADIEEWSAVLSRIRRGDRTFGTGVNFRDRDCSSRNSSTTGVLYSADNVCLVTLGEGGSGKKKKQKCEMTCWVEQALQRAIGLHD